jgi:hypothetical protein
MAKLHEDQLRVNLFTTHVVQNIDRSYCPVLELAPGIPPPNPTANLYVRSQNYAARRGENSV